MIKICENRMKRSGNFGRKSLESVRTYPRNEVKALQTLMASKRGLESVRIYPRNEADFLQALKRSNEW